MKKYFIVLNSIIMASTIQANTTKFGLDLCQKSSVKDKPITITPYNAYYTVANAVMGKQIPSGTKVKGCTIESYTKCVKKDLSHSDLQGAFLAYANLQDSNLKGTNIKLGDIAYANASKTNLSYASLAGLAMNHSNLSSANLTFAGLTNVDASSANFSSAKLINAHMDNSSFINANFSKANLSNANLSSSIFNRANFNKANLSGANLNYANLVGAKNWDKVITNDKTQFCNTIMPDGSIKNREVQCPRTVYYKAKPITVKPYNPFYTLAKTRGQQNQTFQFRQCYLEPKGQCHKITLNCKNLIGANTVFGDWDHVKIMRSTLISATFAYLKAKNTQMRYNQLSGTSYTGGQFQSANLSHSDFQLSALSDANFEQANFAYSNLAFTNLNGSNFKSADLSHANLASTDINGADFTDADMHDANLSDADLTGSTLTNANLKDAIYCNTIMPDGKVKAPHEGLCPQQPK